MIPWPIAVILLFLSARGVVEYFDDFIGFVEKRWGKTAEAREQELRLRVREAIRAGVEEGRKSGT